MMPARPDVFHAVADAKRRRMMDLLLTGEKPVRDIAAHFDMTFQGVSQHLKVLADAGLVRARKSGRYNYYRAHPAGLKHIHAWVSRYEGFWADRLKKLADHLDTT